MIVHPRDWFVHSDNIFLFDVENRIFQIEPFECYYTSKNFSGQKSLLNPASKWKAFPTRPPFYSWKRDYNNRILQLFKATGIKPYQAIRIENVIEGEGINYIAYHQIFPFSPVAPPLVVAPPSLVVASPLIVASPLVVAGTSAPSYSPNRLRMYFDIETYTTTKEFTVPENSEISIIVVIFASDTAKQAFAITTIPDAEYVNIPVIVVSTEKELIEKFYELWKEFSPTEIVHYNGYSFDIPYIIEKTLFYKIDPGSLGFLVSDSQTVETRQIRLATKSLPTKKTTWLLPGVKNIDLLPFFRRFYPELPNHKLDTVSRYILSEGKTDMSIERMFRIVGNGTPKERGEVIHYCFVDVLLLLKLDLHLNVVNNLAAVANSLCVTMEHILTMSDVKLTSSIIYNFDHEVLNKRLEVSAGSPTNKSFKAGIYYNLKTYDYKSLVLECLDSSDPFSLELKSRLVYAPRGISNKILFSNYSPINAMKRLTDKLDSLTRKRKLTLFDDIEEIIAGANVIAITDYCIYTLDKMDLFLVDDDDVRFVNNVSHFSVYEKKLNTFHHYGKVGLPNTTFALQLEYMENYYKETLERGYSKLETTIRLEDIPLLKLTSRVRNRSTYTNTDNIGYILATLMGEEVVTSWRVVHYFKTTEFQQYYIQKDEDDFPPPEIIDLDWYRREMMHVTWMIADMSGNVRR